MKRAVFLDRDGTIIEERGYLGDPGLVSLIPGSDEAIRKLRRAGFVIVVVTNQAGVARGLFDEDAVHAVHRRLTDLLGDAAPDAYYYCPHHPEGSVDSYRRECACRKPGPGMVTRAARELALDIGESFVVGDKWLDVGLANQAGARGILVRTGYGAIHADIPPPGVHADAIASTLLDAADYILSQDRT